MQNQLNPWMFAMNPMMGNGMNFQNQPMNFGGNANWAQLYTGFNNDNNQNMVNQFIPGNQGKINFVFKISNGNKPVNILFDRGRTVEDLIKTYFMRVNKEDLFEKGGVSFIHNATPIDFHEKSKVEEFFHNNAYSIIMVIDINDLIGANYNYNYYNK